MSRVLKHTLLLWITTLTTQSQAFHLDLHATSTWLGTAWFSRLGLDLFPWALLSIDAQSLGFFLPLPFGFKGYCLFLLAFSFSFYFFFRHFFFAQAFAFSLLFLASRINFMIFQIINNIFLCSSFFQEPTILTFINNKIKIMHCSSIHSENKKYCHHINIIKLNSRIISKFMYFLFFWIKNIFHLRKVKD